MRKGLFITCEGGEGAGKTTQLKLLSQSWHNSRIPHIVTREPGGTVVAEKIRTLLVEGNPDALDAEAETLLFYAARQDHVKRVIQPALSKGLHVLCDRFCDSTMVYQGVGKQLGEAYIRMLHHLVLGNVMPDVTLMFDIDPNIGLKRAKSRHGKEDRFEEMEFAFHEMVREGFLTIAKREPERCVVVDASQPEEIVHQQVLNALSARLSS